MCPLTFVPKVPHLCRRYTLMFYDFVTLEGDEHGQATYLGNDLTR